ncbi:hypothetical protein FGB62_95g0104 [Gracilaria domingensis]|nr:hypothetical protein FGB62_326g01 [Gracilaria domingensis]KAI0560970.1 hypothetical protein FGB62_95g0104 [Gracilaria domingensis]
MNSVGYHSIPRTPAFDNKTSDASFGGNGSLDVMPRRFSFSMVRGKLFTVLAVLTALTAVVFAANESSVWLPRLDYDQFRSIPGSSGSWYSSGLQYGRHRIQYYLNQKYSSSTARASPPLNNVIRNEVCEKDSIVQKAVGTKDCASGLECRARVVVTTARTGTTIRAGYYICSVGNVNPVSGLTQERVKAVTLAEATTWAEQLYVELETELESVECTVTVPMIANAIMETKDDAASCPDTNDSRCSELVTLKECLCETEPVIGNDCYNFLASDPKVAGFNDLKRGCKDSNFNYNRLGTSLPFCTFTCSSEPSLLRTFDGRFHVQGYGRGDRRNVFAVAIPLAYKKFALPLPSCDITPTFEKISTYYILSCWHSSRNPAFAKDLSSDPEVIVRSSYFRFEVASAQQYISSVCES